MKLSNQKLYQTDFMPICTKRFLGSGNGYDYYLEIEGQYSQPIIIVRRSESTYVRYWLDYYEREDQYPYNDVYYQEARAKANKLMMLK
jgi:hypothetical protein